MPACNDCGQLFSERLLEQGLCPPCSSKKAKVRRREAADAKQHEENREAIKREQAIKRVEEPTIRGDYYDHYSEYTKSHDWAAICTFNGVELSACASNAKKALKVLPNFLTKDEVVFALISGVVEQTKTSSFFDSGPNQSLGVLTNGRFLFIESPMLASPVDTLSIRHDRVQAVSASQGWVLGKVMLDLGSRVLVIDQCIKGVASVFASLSNKWLKELSESKNASQASASAPTEETPLDKLEKLANLHSMGALSDEEFKAAKEEILSSLSK